MELIHTTPLKVSLCFTDSCNVSWPTLTLHLWSAIFDTLGPGPRSETYPWSWGFGWEYINGLPEANQDVPEGWGRWCWCLPLCCLQDAVAVHDTHFSEGLAILPDMLGEILLTGGGGIAHMRLHRQAHSSLRRTLCTSIYILKHPLWSGLGWTFSGTLPVLSSPIAAPPLQVCPDSNSLKKSSTHALLLQALLLGNLIQDR